MSGERRPLASPADNQRLRRDKRQGCRLPGRLPDIAKFATASSTEDRRPEEQEKETRERDARSPLVPGGCVVCWWAYSIHVRPHHTAHRTTQLAVGVTGTFWVLGGPAVYGEGTADYTR
jgi:hypothetical protein